MKKPENNQLNHLIVQHTLDSVQLIWTMSILCFYLDSLPKQPDAEVVTQDDKEQLLKWLYSVKLQLHEKVSESQFIQCRNIIDRTILQGICTIKDKMQSQLATTNDVRLVNQLSNCFNGFVHSLQFIRKLPVGNTQSSYEIPSKQWQVLLEEQEQINSNWKLQLNRFGVMSAQLVASNGIAREFMSQFNDEVLGKLREGDGRT